MRLFATVSSLENSAYSFVSQGMKHLKRFPRHHPLVEALSFDGVTDSRVLAPSSTWRKLFTIVLMQTQICDKFKILGKEKKQSYLLLILNFVSLLVVFWNLGQEIYTENYIFKLVDQTNFDLKRWINLHISYLNSYIFSTIFLLNT